MHTVHAVHLCNLGVRKQMEPTAAALARERQWIAVNKGSGLRRGKGPTEFFLLATDKMLTVLTTTEDITAMCVWCNTATSHHCITASQFSGLFLGQAKTILFFSFFFYLTEHPNYLQSSVAFTATTIKHSWALAEQQDILQTLHSTIGGKEFIQEREKLKDREIERGKREGWGRVIRLEHSFFRPLSLLPRPTPWAGSVLRLQFRMSLFGYWCPRQRAKCSAPFSVYKGSKKLFSGMDLLELHHSQSF